MSQRTALYRCFDADGRLLYVGASRNPARRLGEHNRWNGDVATITVAWHDTPEAAAHAERTAITEERPMFNAQHNGRWRVHTNHVADVQNAEDLDVMSGAVAAAMLGVDRRTVHRWGLSGKLTARRAGRFFVYPAAEVRALVGDVVEPARTDRPRHLIPVEPDERRQVSA